MGLEGPCFIGEFSGSCRRTPRKWAKTVRRRPSQVRLGHRRKGAMRSLSDRVRAVLSGVQAGSRFSPSPGSTPRVQSIQGGDAPDARLRRAPVSGGRARGLRPLQHGRRAGPAHVHRRRQQSGVDPCQHDAHQRQRSGVGEPQPGAADAKRRDAGGVRAPQALAGQLRRRAGCARQDVRIARDHRARTPGVRGPEGAEGQGVAAGAPGRRTRPRQQGRRSLQGPDRSARTGPGRVAQAVDRAGRPRGRAQSPGRPRRPRHLRARQAGVRRADRGGGADRGHALGAGDAQSHRSVGCRARHAVRTRPGDGRRRPRQRDRRRRRRAGQRGAGDGDDAGVAAPDRRRGPHEQRFDRDRRDPDRLGQFRPLAAHPGAGRQRRGDGGLDGADRLDRQEQRRGGPAGLRTGPGPRARR